MHYTLSCQAHQADLEFAAWVEWLICLLTLTGAEHLPHSLKLMTWTAERENCVLVSSERVFPSYHLREDVSGVTFLVQSQKQPLNKPLSLHCKNNPISFTRTPCWNKARGKKNALYIRALHIKAASCHKTSHFLTGTEELTYWQQASNFIEIYAFK